MTPLERVGGLIGRTIRGRGMDIFWNHTFPKGRHTLMVLILERVDCMFLSSFSNPVAK